MDVSINGLIRKIPESVSIAQLIDLLELKKERVAIELNRSIVSRKEWDAVSLKPGDSVEIVHFVGGG